VHIATSSVAAADIAGGRLGGATGSELVAAAHSAFVHAMAMGMRVAACVAIASALAAYFALPRRPLPQGQDAAAGGVTGPVTAVLVPAG
jgi:hypothetical protein